MGLTAVSLTTGPIPLDEYPIHQAPVPMNRVASSDRNFYDRCYFNAHDRTGEVFLVTGLGVYPNLGVIDAYATARVGDRQWSVRFSDALAERSLDQHVGGYRIDVLEPLRRLHRRVVIALAVVLPAAFVAGLAARRPTQPLNPGIHWTAPTPLRNLP